MLICLGLLRHGRWRTVALELSRECPVDVEGEFQGVDCAGGGDLVVGLAAHGQHVIGHCGVLVRGR